MDPSYETVVDIQELIWTMGVYVLHALMVAVQTGLAVFLLATGIHQLLLPALDGPWLRRFGGATVEGTTARMLGGVRVLLGAALFTPLGLGAPVAASLIAGVAAFVLLLLFERALSQDANRSGRFVRRAAITFAAVVPAFMLWEGEDNLALGADLLVQGMEWRNEELGWQLEKDPQSPKLGELAPDFELQDPEGNVQVRLSDFRGKRPVALVFGSYT